MIFLETGDDCVDVQQFHEGDPTVGGLVVHALPGILRGCELARTLEEELPRISSQTHLLLLSCKQIASAFREAASSLMSTGGGGGSTNSTTQNQHQQSSPGSSPPQNQWHVKSPPSNQQQQHNPSPVMPGYEHLPKQQDTPSDSQHQYYLYGAPSSPASPGAALLGVDEFLADVDLDFLSSEEFNLGGASSPEAGCDAAGADGQYSSGSVDHGSAVKVAVATASVTEIAGVDTDAAIGRKGVASAKDTKRAEEVDDGSTSQPRPSAEESSRQRLSKKRKDTGDSALMRTIRLPAPRTGDLEAPPDDGYAWRKYGHKDILNARFPRCYYRCIYKNCCDAKKQVQRLDHDPFTYEITYYGQHSCHGALPEGAAPAGGQQLRPQPAMLIPPSSSTSNLQDHPGEAHAGDSRTTTNKKARWPPTK